MRSFPKSILGLALLAGLSLPSFASADIFEDFSGTSIPSTLVNTYGAGSAPTGGGTFDGMSAIVGGEQGGSGADGDLGRAYFGTVQSDFGLLDFVAEIDVTVGGNGESGPFTSFFGIGAGVGGGPNNGGGFDEPTAGPDQNSIFLGVRGTANYLLFDENSDGTLDVGRSNVRSADSAFGGAGAGTHRVRFEHDATAGTIAYSIDLNQTGTFAPLFTFDSSNNGFDATNSQIFFGGSNSRIFDNFSVVVTAVPEPTSLSVIGLLGLGLFSRRRRS